MNTGKELRKARNALVTFQGMILVCVILVSMLLFSVFSVKKLTAIWLSELEDTAQFLSEQIRKDVLDKRGADGSGESVGSLQGDLTSQEYLALMRQQGVEVVQGVNPQERLQDFKEDVAEFIIGRNNYSMFVLDQDGTFIVPHDDSLVEGAVEWAQYRNKLIYEMRKQKQGVAFYPRLDAWDIRQGVHVIRYMHIEELGWIVGLEGYRGSMLSFIGEAFDGVFYIYLFGLLIIGMIVIRLTAHWMISRAHRIISYDLEQQVLSPNDPGKLFENSGFREQVNAPISPRPKLTVRKESSDFGKLNKGAEFIATPKASDGLALGESENIFKSRSVERVAAKELTDAVAENKTSQPSGSDDEGSGSGSQASTDPWLSPKEYMDQLTERDLAQYRRETRKNISMPLLKKMLSDIRTE